MERLTISQIISEYGRYRYEGVPLQPSIFAELMLLLFNGKRFKREEAIKAVKEYHAQHGGSLDHFSGPAVFKKAASYLKRQGLENINYGYWQLVWEDDKQHRRDAADSESSSPQVPDSQEITGTTQSPASVSIPHADLTLGDGAQGLYVYYFDAYRQYAEIRKRITWPCGIIRTQSDFMIPRLSQYTGFYPEPPHFALLLKCDDATSLYEAIRNMLHLRGQSITNSFSSGWYDTNPDEIREIYLLSQPKGAKRPNGTSLRS